MYDEVGLCAQDTFLGIVVDAVGTMVCEIIQWVQQWTQYGGPIWSLK